MAGKPGGYAWILLDDLLGGGREYDQMSRWEEQTAEGHTRGDKDNTHAELGA